MNKPEVGESRFFKSDPGREYICTASSGHRDNYTAEYKTRKGMELASKCKPCPRKGCKGHTVGEASWPDPCPGCGRPGFKSTENACRHLRLMRSLDRGYFGCLSCEARFTAGAMDHCNIVVRGPDNMFSDHAAEWVSRPPPQLHHREDFLVADESSLRDISILNPLNDAAQPPIAGWGWPISKTQNEQKSTKKFQPISVGFVGHDEQTTPVQKEARDQADQERDTSHDDGREGVRGSKLGYEPDPTHNGDTGGTGGRAGMGRDSVEQVRRVEDYAERMGITFQQSQYDLEHTRMLNFYCWECDQITNHTTDKNLSCWCRRCGRSTTGILENKSSRPADINDTVEPRADDPDPSDSKGELATSCQKCGLELGQGTHCQRCSVNPRPRSGRRKKVD